MKTHILNKAGIKFIEDIQESKKKSEERIKELHKISLLAEEAYKKVSTTGKASSESMFKLGFISGYKKKQNEK